jgi:hypothetical protein
VQYARSCHNIIRSWWGHLKRIRIDTHGIYSTMSLDTHMVFVAMMICRLFEKRIPTHLLVEWVSIMNEIAEDFTFN